MLRPHIPNRPRGVPGAIPSLPSMLGGRGDDTHWDLAWAFYEEDRVLEAMDQALRAGHTAIDGGQWFRLIEAEAVTRQHSVTIELTDRLEFEYIPGELDGEHGEIGRLIAEACDEVESRLGLRLPGKARVAILAEEVQNPWTVDPDGYCTAKVPYSKICLPAYLLDDWGELAGAVRHEYTHALADQVGDVPIPSWVQEAVAMVMEGDPVDPVSGDGFELRAELDAEEGFGGWDWLGPAELEAAFREGRTEEDDERVWGPYRQAEILGLEMVRAGGETSLGTFMRSAAKNRGLAEVAARLVGRDGTDLALREVYGWSTRELFERGRERWASVYGASG
ncbi:MAG: hypothetical protein SNJ74_00455 [Fimbriimonadaceae bacterium]